MRKAELVAALAKATGLSRVQADQVVNVILDEINFALARGEAVSLPGFGSFSCRQRAARTGRNPQTGAEINIPASNTVLFRAGKGLKEAVAGDA